MRGALVRALLERHALPSALQAALLTALDAIGDDHTTPHAAMATEDGSDGAVVSARRAAEALTRSVLPMLAPSHRVDLLSESLRKEGLSTAKRRGGATFAAGSKGAAGAGRGLSVEAADESDGTQGAASWRERLLRETFSSPNLSPEARDRVLESCLGSLDRAAKASFLNGLLQRRELMRGLYPSLCSLGSPAPPTPPTPRTHSAGSLLTLLHCSHHSQCLPRPRCFCNNQVSLSRATYGRFDRLAGEMPAADMARVVGQLRPQSRPGDSRDGRRRAEAEEGSAATEEADGRLAPRMAATEMPRGDALEEAEAAEEAEAEAEAAEARRLVEQRAWSVLAMSRVVLTPRQRAISTSTPAHHQQALALCGAACALQLHADLVALHVRRQQPILVGSPLTPPLPVGVRAWRLLVHQSGSVEPARTRVKDLATAAASVTAKHAFEGSRGSYSGGAGKGEREREISRLRTTVFCRLLGLLPTETSAARARAACGATRKSAGSQSILSKSGVALSKSGAADVGASLPTSLPEGGGEGGEWSVARQGFLLRALGALFSPEGWMRTAFCAAPASVT